jgi:hypothetical protein
VLILKKMDEVPKPALITAIGSSLHERRLRLAAQTANSLAIRARHPIRTG